MKLTLFFLAITLCAHSQMRAKSLNKWKQCIINDSVELSYEVEEVVPFFEVDTQYMARPGEPFGGDCQSGDTIKNACLIFQAHSNNKYILLFRQGGYSRGIICWLYDAEEEKNKQFYSGRLPLNSSLEIWEKDITFELFRNDVLQGNINLKAFSKNQY
ncbi:MAG: hypothetical protein MRY83_14925 [Flavobacteriales bacterium]|nr:hypothetical protein [Flavobacteriales bacterium]